MRLEQFKQRVTAFLKKYVIGRNPAKVMTQFWNSMDDTFVNDSDLEGGGDDDI